MGCFLQLLILLCALSVDTFATSLAYSAKKIKIPKRSGLLICFICAFVVAVGIEIGAAACWVLPKGTKISAVMLGGLGFFEVFEAWIKKWIHTNNKKHFKFFNFHFFLEIICDSTQADIDCSKDLSIKEALPLALALSLDGIVVGTSAGMMGFSVGVVFLLALAFGICAMAIGKSLGRKISKERDLSLLSGIVLLILSILKLKS